MKLFMFFQHKLEKVPTNIVYASFVNKITRVCRALNYQKCNLSRTFILFTNIFIITFILFNHFMIHMKKWPLTIKERNTWKFLKLCLNTSSKFNKFLISQCFSQNRCQCTRNEYIFSLFHQNKLNKIPE